MRVKAPGVDQSTGIATAQMECYYWPIKGGPRHKLGVACGFDSDEKWVEVYIWTPLQRAKTGRFMKHRVMTADGKLQTAKLYINYDIVDKRTGDIIVSVRQ